MKKVVLLTLGGTITMVPDQQSAGGIQPKLGASDLLAAVPDLAHIADIHAHTFSMIPGASLSLENIRAVAQQIQQFAQEGFDGVVVVQGTDTLEDTAFILDCLLQESIGVVVTGAMRGPAMVSADGPANLLAATQVAAAPESAGYGVLVVLNQEIHAARYVQKSHTSALESFTSQGAALIGNIVESRIRWFAQLHQHPAIAVGDHFPAVWIYQTYMGDQGEGLAQMLQDPSVRGIILCGTGAGHVSASLVSIVEAAAKNVPVILSSRVPAGFIFSQTYGFLGSEISLGQVGVIGAGILRSNKAQLLLRMILSTTSDRQCIADIFSLRAGSFLPTLR